MKTKILVYFFFCIVIGNCSLFAQQIYVDPATTAALAGYAAILKNGQKETANQQSKLKKAQVFVGGRLELVHRVQKKLYKGLREVSGTLQNSIQVKQIYEEIKDCYYYSKKIKDLVSHKPQYAVFGVKASERTYEQLLKISTELSSLLTSSDTNLATAGDRYKILYKIEGEVQQLKLWLISISLTLERAVRIGFLKSLNPFQGYVDTDKDIIESVMWKWKTL